MIFELNIFYFNIIKYFQLNILYIFLLLKLTIVITKVSLFRLLIFMEIFISNLFSLYDNLIMNDIKCFINIQ